MIQRVQTLWLLLVALLAAVTFRFPFYTGDWAGDDPVTNIVDMNARFSILFTILTVVVGALGFVTIFLFDNRKLQLKLCYLGMFLTGGLLALYFIELEEFKNGSIALWCIFYFGVLAGYILAARGIWKDQKLIRSMDRLR